MNETRDLIIGIDFGKEYSRSVIMTQGRGTAFTSRKSGKQPV